MNPAFDPRSLTHFLHDCFREDHRSQEVLDLYSSKVERKHFFTGDADLLSEGCITVEPNDELEELAKVAHLHQTEKSLSLGVLFAVGSTASDDGKRSLICAPLVTYPLSLMEVEDSRKLIWCFDPHRPRLHHTLLGRRAAEHGIAQEAIERVFENGFNELDLESIRTLGNALAKLLTDLDATPLDTFPPLAEAGRLRKLRAEARHQDSDTLKLVPAMVAMLIRRSLETRGVLSELERLASPQEEPSIPLLALFDQLKPVRHQTPGRADKPNAESLSVAGLKVNAPALLSDAQERIVKNAAHFPLSLVIGPPGTGKSFTIAAIALDALAHGDSVLITSRTHHAVDVIGDKLEGLLGQQDFVVRGGRKNYQKELKERVIGWLSGNLPGRPSSVPAVHKTLNQLKSLAAEIEDIETRLAARSRLEESWGHHVVEGPGKDRWLDRLTSRYRQWKLGRELGELPNSYWQEMEDYRRALERRMELQADLIRRAIRARLHHILSRQRRQLTRFRDAIRARTGRRREDLFESIDLEVLLHALPVWLVNLTDAASTLPLRRQMFDLVIIDESTQCDIASCLPMLQRAKRAVIVGDPKQLRHLSFLARDRQEAFANQYGLSPEAKARFDYRDKSILDLVDDSLDEQQQVVMLDEHFRSVPSIISFSNREFYADRLRVMQEHPAHDYHRALYLHRLSGSRGADGSNPIEAQALINVLAERVEEESGRPREMVSSLGVLSPFRDQVELITLRLTECLGSPAIQRHRIKVGTAYAFQGEERDVMYLSLALDPRSHPSAFRFLERKDVFNVAVTRARSEQWVFTSLLGADPASERQPWHGGKDSLLRRFLDHMEIDQPPAPDHGPMDPFLKEVKTLLELKKYRVWAAYPVAGLEVDLVVESQGRCLGIDLVGYPGAYVGAFELERYRMFNRAGLPLMPLPYFAWLTDSAACLRAIAQRLSPRGAS